MIKPTKLIIVFICSVFSHFSYAENMLVDANMFYTIPDAGGTDNFHTGKILSVNFNYYVFPWLAITSGLYTSEEISDNVTTDIVGTYQASIETRGFTLGLRPEYVFSKRNKVYARAGLLFYKTDITVEEYFEPGLPTGSSSDSTDGSGFLLALGWSHSFTEKVSFQLEFKSLQQKNLFDGKTTADNVFDITYSGFSLGLGYAF